MLETIVEGKRSLQIKYERLLAENENLQNEMRSLSVANKTAVKQLKDASHKFEKKFEDLTDNNKTLADFKMIKIAEEKELKSINKTIEK